MLLNCDMGESFGPWKMGMDDQVMPFIDLANVACGFHASDPNHMLATVKLAIEYDVRVGAHPGYPDLMGFGRRDIPYTKAELVPILLYQIGALDAICRSQGTKIHYVKPHGALYNKMMVDDQILSAAMEAVRAFNPQCPLVVMATPNHKAVAQKGRDLGLEIWFEAFSDRAYDDQGLLVNRKTPGAVHQSAEAIEAQVTQICRTGTVTTLSGKRLDIHADTLCVHGDGAHAGEAARHMRAVVSSL